MHILLIKILIKIPIMVESTERCFFKTKINKILFKVYYVTREIKWISHIIN